MQFWTRESFKCRGSTLRQNVGACREGSFVFRQCLLLQTSPSTSTRCFCLGPQSAFKQQPPPHKALGFPLHCTQYTGAWSSRGCNWLSHLLNICYFHFVTKRREEKRQAKTSALEFMTLFGLRWFLLFKFLKNYKYYNIQMNGFGVTYEHEYIRLCSGLHPLLSAWPHFILYPALVTPILHSVH